jgi:hypothetical protein
LFDCLRRIGGCGLDRTDLHLGGFARMAERPGFPRCFAFVYCTRSVFRFCHTGASFDAHRSVPSCWRT